ncbi:hypothetical protein HOP50_12g67270 [Chloropicon primus]|uniref:Uncharacterized protein n=2 Tax=Chloropicon primus TaxID=1764295 RepID=A0A5B8MXI3_9CHLO|nr:hypothetical protein A3770_12p67080 [Chloropicon primus]UPR03398.1 hypothetical protein HOP50_12g67270 [Chloropicon primus]|eukprot:QDZ24190.1 hypothetical protein A3770_12p67080 [Chloropicon primus]
MLTEVSTSESAGLKEAGEGGDERRLFCLEVVVDKCSEKGTEKLYAKHKPKTTTAPVNVKGVKDMEDLKNRLTSYLKEAQRSQFQLPQESEYASRACAVRFLDYPLLIIDRAKAKSPPTVSSHPLRGVEVGIPFGQGKSCMFHTSARKLVRLLRDHPLHFVYLDLRRRAEPKLVGTASLPLSDALVLEQKGLHTHTPIYSITGESVGVLSVYLRLSCHGSTLLRHLVNFKGISSPMKSERVGKGGGKVNKGNMVMMEEEVEGEKEYSLPSPSSAPAVGSKSKTSRSEKIKSKAVADLSSIRSFQSTKAAMYGSFKPPSLFYDPEMEESDNSDCGGQQQEDVRVHQSRVLASRDSVLRGEDTAEEDETSFSSSFSRDSEEKPSLESRDVRRATDRSAEPERSATTRALRERSIQANMALDTHEIIRELALEISNAIKSGTGSLLSQVGIRKEDSFVSVSEREEPPMPELDLKIEDKDEGTGLLTTSNVEDELEQLLQDLEQKPITSIMYGDQGATLEEEVRKESREEQSKISEAALPSEPAPTAQIVPPHREDQDDAKVEEGPEETREEETPVREAGNRPEGGGGSESAAVPDSSEKQVEQDQRLILSDPSEEAKEEVNESSTEESYTPIEDDVEEADLQSESTLLSIKPPETLGQGFEEVFSPQAMSVAEDILSSPVPPPPPPPEVLPPQEYDDAIQKTMVENPAMAAVDKLWEAEYSDVNTDLDSILTEGSLDLLASGTEADSFIVEEELSKTPLEEEISISEEIIDEEVGGQDQDDSRASESQVELPPAGGGIKRVFTLFKSKK